MFLTKEDACIEHTGNDARVVSLDAPKVSEQDAERVKKS